MTHSQSRPAFTVVEMTVAMTIVMIVLGMVASMAVWNFRERANNQARMLALEAANNVLEEALAEPWEAITPEWGKSRTLSENAWLPDAKVEVTVSDESGEKGLKRVVVNVSWSAAENSTPHVELVGFVTARRPSAAGGAK